MLETLYSLPTETIPTKSVESNPFKDIVTTKDKALFLLVVVGIISVSAGILSYIKF